MTFEFLLKFTRKEIEPYSANNISVGFCKVGLVPINRDIVLSMIQEVDYNNAMNIQTFLRPAEANALWWK